jgi:hypothetical protein
MSKWVYKCRAAQKWVARYLLGYLCRKKANDAMISESPIPGSDRNARNKKKPVYLAHAGCFLEAEEAEDFIKSMGYTVKEVRKHYMKGTDITLYVLDYFSFIQSFNQSKIKSNQ